jgi:hypothetical protein
MTSVINKIFLLIILFIPSLLAQNSLDQQYQLTNKLIVQEKYFDAITELKRLQFFDKQDVFSYQTNLLIGKSYKAGAKYDEAVKYFTLAEISSKSDEEYFISKVFNARTNILRRTTKQAERILNDLLNDARYTSKEKEIKYWLGWNYIFSDNWEKAFEIFHKNNLDTSLTVLCKNVQEDLYSVNFAKYSSYIIPGFGQFYTGEYLSGALSLGWNILFGYLTINSVVEERIFDAIVIGNFLWLRFYSGNIQNAEKFAIQKNREISNKALEILQNKSVIERP